MDRFFRPQFRPAPVREGEVIDVKIEAVGEKGDGIARVNGFVVFVPGKKEGETAKIRITKVLRKVAFAEVAGESAAPAAEQAAAPEEQVKEKKPKKAKKEVKEEPKVEIVEQDSEEF